MAESMASLLDTYQEGCEGLPLLTVAQEMPARRTEEAEQCEKARNHKAPSGSILLLCSSTVVTRQWRSKR
jgi:hypothetical protein